MAKSSSSSSADGDTGTTVADATVTTDGVVPGDGSSPLNEPVPTDTGDQATGDQTTPAATTPEGDRNEVNPAPDATLGNITTPGGTIGLDVVQPDLVDDGSSEFTQVVPGEKVDLSGVPEYANGDLADAPDEIVRLGGVLPPGYGNPTTPDIEPTPRSLEVLAAMDEPQRVTY